MELSKALETIKAICDDAVKNGRFNSLEQTTQATDAFNTLVNAASIVANQQKDTPKVLLKPEPDSTSVTVSGPAKLSAVQNDDKNETSVTQNQTEAAAQQTVTQPSTDGQA